VSDRIARAVFGLLFETSAEAVFVVDRGTQRIVSANVRAGDMLSIDTNSLIGMRIAELSSDPERDLLAHGHYEEVALRRGDGYPIYVELEVAHVETAEHGPLAAYMARDTSERRLLENELHAKHTALFTAYADLERAHAQLSETKHELETRNHEIAMLAWRAAMGELVAGIAHHLNNPVGALASTTLRLQKLTAQLPDHIRSEHERLLARVAQIARRIESNVAAIVQASRSDGSVPGREIPPEIATVLASFSERMDDIPTKESQP
jgi:PAS domain S-box-containing protein